MKYDPSKTKTLTRSYEQQVIRLFNSFKKKVYPRILALYRMNKPKMNDKHTLDGRVKIQHNAISDITNIIDNYSYQEINSHLKPIVNKYVRQAYDRGGKKAESYIVKDNIEFKYFFTPRDLQAVSVLAQNNFRLISATTELMKKDMLTVITQGMLEGQSIHKMAKALNGKINKSKYNCRRIARTEVLRSYNQAHINQYKKVGIKRWEWITAWDDRTCDMCMGNDGRVFKIGDPQPPLHPNCRCSVKPVVESK